MEGATEELADEQERQRKAHLAAQRRAERQKHGEPAVSRAKKPSTGPQRDAQRPRQEGDLLATQPPSPRSENDMDPGVVDGEDEDNELGDPWAMLLAGELPREGPGLAGAQLDALQAMMDQPDHEGREPGSNPGADGQ